MRFLENFPPALRSSIILNEPLTKYCIYRVGGQAEFFFEAHNIEDLRSIIESAFHAKIPFHVIGQGSNVLFRDEGYRGLIVRNMTKHFELFFSVENLKKHSYPVRFVADSGLSMSTFVQYVSSVPELDFSLVESFHGLPGTIGGATYGNAGCFGKEFCELIESVEILRIHNDTITHKVLHNKPKELEFGYRLSSFKQYDESINNGKSNTIILRVTLQLKTADENPKPRQNIIKLRAFKQPPGLSCGSYFKNPSGSKSAGQLIEEAGCKGMRVGGAQVSEKHGNWILNVDNAHACDILHLAKDIQSNVYEKFGIRLEPEVRII